MNLVPRVIFEDEVLLVIDKPAGMVVNRSETTKGERTVQDWVEDYLKIRSTKHPEVERSSLQGSPVLSLALVLGHEARNNFKIINSNDENSFEFRNVRTREFSVEKPDFEFSRRAGVVHRLDKETSGLLIVAKTPEAFENLQRQFKERQVKKTYIALVHGEVKPEEGEINVPVGRLPWNRKRFGIIPGGRESTTRYTVLGYYNRHSGKPDRAHPESNEILKQVQDDRRDSGQARITEHYTLLELYPETGRTHQIRVHLKYVGHPIFGDSQYGGRKRSRADRKILSRLFLHAAKISFFHPASRARLDSARLDARLAERAGGPKTGERITFESPLPEELKKLLI